MPPPSIPQQITMAINNSNDVAASCEDEEMVQYKKSGLSVVTFHIVRDENDLSAPKKSNSFKPDMAHQIFGDTEMIFGYKQLSIDLHYLHNSAKCYVDVHEAGKIPESENNKADDFMQSLNNWLPMKYRVDKETFLKDLEEEDHSLMFGETLQSFEQNGKTYKINLCDATNEDFKNFHQRFETFIVWFIDGANYIDLEDERWTIFYVYEEFTDPENKKLYRTPVAFCTVYRFFLYPNQTRPRISQFFVLPTYQKRGIGTKLYSAVYEHLRVLPNSGDITVEEPTEIFQRIRDFCDSLQVYMKLEEKNICISTQNSKQISGILKDLKICKRQSRRVFDILECLISHKSGYDEYLRFTENIKGRIKAEVEKETRGSKRLCNSERMAVFTQPIDKKAAVETEYKKYIDSLEWPTKRLMNHVAKKTT